MLEALSPYGLYAVGSVAFLLGLVWADRYAPLGDSVLLALFWPLSLVVIVLMFLAVGLLHLGFRARFGRPKPGLGWSAGRCRLRPGLPPRRLVGVWVACPWWAASVWWAGRPPPLKESP